MLEEVLMFDACETQQCVAVTIVDDMIDEPEENFHVSLERTPDLDSRITLEPVEGEILIIDNDGMHSNTNASLTLCTALYTCYTVNVYKQTLDTDLTS